MISTLFISGLLGSLGHCMGMCGPLVIMVGAQFGATTWARKLLLYLVYHSARIVTYFAMGFVAGMFGWFISMGHNFTKISGVLSLIFGAGVVLLGLRYLGLFSLSSLEGPSAWTGRMMKKALQHGGLSGLASLGALNGLLPCGLVYSALLVAAAMGTPIKAGMAMAAFGVGTLPALLVLGMGSGALSIRTRQTMSRVAGLLITLVGVQLIFRGAAGLGWLSHWMLGGVMIY